MSPSSESSAGVIFVAINVAKQTHEVLIEPSEGGRQRWRMVNCHRDYTTLQRLQAFEAPVLIGFAATDTYHLTTTIMPKLEGWVHSIGIPPRSAQDHALKTKLCHPTGDLLQRRVSSHKIHAHPLEVHVQTGIPRADAGKVSVPCLLSLIFQFWLLQSVASE